MNENDTARHVSRLVTAAKSYLDEQEKGRKEAIEYYDGTMTDMPAESERSSVVSTDLRATIKKLLPSVMRTILGNDKIVEYLPTGPEDEEGCKEATNYINSEIIPECDAEKAIFDAIHDAMRLKTGILKWSCYIDSKAIVTPYNDISDDDALGLFDDGEAIDHEKLPETDAEILERDPNAMRHTFKRKQIKQTKKFAMEAVPRGVFLITPNADSIEEAELTGEEKIATRSKLVSMDYDKDKVAALSRLDGKDDDGDRDAQMGDDATSETAETQKAMEEVRYYEVYVKMDRDNDGIAELWRIVYGDERGTSDTVEKTNSYIILGEEMVDEAPYAEIVIERDPHQFEGHSIHEDTKEIQRVKTAVTRSTLNNLYDQNDPRPVVETGAVENPEDLTNRAEPLYLKKGKTVKDAIDYDRPPYVGQYSMAMLDYMDSVAQDRHGVTDASGGLDAEAFQNTSATAANMMGQSGADTAEFIIRNIAGPIGGLGKAFMGLLKLVVAHTDEPRTVKVKEEWVTYDPSNWSPEMKCKVNVGLGGGTKERDMAVLQIVLGLQKEILLTIGADNPFVKPNQFYNTLAKITETAGLVSPDPFFTEPDMEKVEADIAAGKNKPNPEMIKLQAQMQLEDKKMQGAQAKEHAQMQADLTVKQAEIAAKTQENREALALQREQDARADALERDKMAMDLLKHRETIASQQQTARTKEASQNV